MNNNQNQQADLSQAIITDIEYATKTELNIEAGIRAENDGVLTNQINNKQDQTDNTLTTTSKTIVGAINENLMAINTKQDTLIDSGDNQNIKTINSQSILGVGDVIINDGRTDLDDNIEIYDNEDNNFVQYKATDLDWTAASDQSLTSKRYVDQQDTKITNSISAKADTTYVDSQDALKQNIIENTLNTTSKTIVGAINELVKAKINKDYLNDQLSIKQNTLVNNGNNQNIKTINGHDILGQGDLTIKTPDVTKYYVDSQNENLQRQINKGYYWKPINITGAKTRNVNVIGNLQVNKIYKIAYTWSGDAHSNITYKEYLHLNNKNVDLERYLHSSLIGLLPNVLALENNGNIGFRIYEAIGVQNTDGFIVAVYILSKLD